MGEATIQTSIWGWRGGSAQNPHRFPSISPSETGQSLRREAQPGWKTAHPPCAAASRSRGPCPAEPRRGGGKRARRAPAGTGRGEAAAAAGVEAGGGGRCGGAARFGGEGSYGGLSKCLGGKRGGGGGGCPGQQVVSGHREGRSGSRAPGILTSSCTRVLKYTPPPPRGKKKKIFREGQGSVPGCPRRGFGRAGAAVLLGGRRGSVSLC